MRRFLAVLAATSALLATALIAAPTASANTLDSFTLSPSSALPGDTVTATATWTATDAGNRDISIVLPNTLTATWASASTVPSRFCTTATPPTDAACLWNAHVSGDTITMTAVLTLAANAAPGDYNIVAGASPADSNGPLTRVLTVGSDSTPAISVTPNPVQAGATATATGTFTATTTGDIRVGVYLLGTGGNGIFGSPVTATGLDNCSLDVSQRAYNCDWLGATVGQTRTIQIPVVVAPGTPSGSTFTLEACSNRNFPAQRCVNTALTITTVAPPTPTPTTTTTTGAPTPSTSTSDPAVPTEVPAGEGPLDPPTSGTNGLALGLVALLAGAGVLSVVAVTRRRGKHQV